ncbi:hypothetical protein Tco_1225569, partial [Tanacetum coccineum]
AFEEDKEDEHLALTDSTLPASNSVPLTEVTEPFETDESAATPPLPRSCHIVVPLSSTSLRRERKTVRPQPPMAASTEAIIVEYAYAPTPPSPPPSPLSPLSSLLPRIPSPPLLLPLLHTSLTYVRAPLGFRAAMVDMPSQKRLCLTAPASRYEVGESSIAAAARQTGHTLARRVDYRFIDTLDASIRAFEGRVMTVIEEVNEKRIISFLREQGGHRGMKHDRVTRDLSTPTQSPRSMSQVANSSRVVDANEEVPHTGADTQAVTVHNISSELELRRIHTGQESSVVAALTLLNL